MVYSCEEVSKYRSSKQQHMHCVIPVMIVKFSLPAEPKFESVVPPRKPIHFCMWT